MHEIPPLQHKNRGTVLDVHHTILPPTSGIQPDPAGLFARGRGPLAPWAFFGVLGPADRVIHSACHLFFGEFHKGLRDLHDLHALLTPMAADAGHWQALVSRSIELGLALPVLDALEQCQRLYETAVPPSAVDALRRAATTPWPSQLRGWLFDHALRPAHVSAYSRSTRLAHWLTFVRSHWLRMPLPLLAYHLSHKFFVDR
ncbi:MAG: nucleotidyltransferase family protein [Betaproteobacteria bacterium]|nr:nucleotidyltransferase family protein [Betaproteobacteria bacterium]